MTLLVYVLWLQLISCLSSQEYFSEYRCGSIISVSYAYPGKPVSDNPISLDSSYLAKQSYSDLINNEKRTAWGTEWKWEF